MFEEVLLNNSPSIVQKVYEKLYYKYQTFFSYDRDYKKELLLDVILSNIQTAYKSYQPKMNTALTEEEVVNNFIVSLTASKYGYFYIQLTKRSYFKKQTKEVNIDMYTDNKNESTTKYTYTTKNGQKQSISSLSEIVDESQNIEGDFMYKMEMDFSKRIYNDMLSYYRNSPNDTLIIKLFFLGDADEKIAAVLGIEKEKAKQLINLMKYRFACQAATYNYYSLDTELKGLNLFPKQNKHYFGVSKLIEKPSIEQLRAIACGKAEKVKKTSNNNKTFGEQLSDSDLHSLVMKFDPKAVKLSARRPSDFHYKSTRRLDGSTPNHRYKVYINKYGWAYDHVSNKTINLKEMMGVE